jgi:hypothetical protein
MPVMKPLTLERNFTPSSTDEVSESAANVVGVAEAGHMLAPDDMACACTVSVVLPVMPDSVAEMAVVPAATAVARPLALTVATSVFDEAHVAWLVQTT